MRNASQHFKYNNRGATIQLEQVTGALCINFVIIHILLFINHARYLEIDILAVNIRVNTTSHFNYYKLSFDPFGLI